MYERQRNLVIRPDGRLVNVARPRGQLFVCHNNCCCGRVEDGFASVPADLYHEEWERRRLRNIVHLTIGGCLGPCALANVVLLLFDGQALWFHSVNHPWMVYALYDYVEAMLDADRVLPPPRVLQPYWFTASAWQARPDGQPVDDKRFRRRRTGGESCRPGHQPIEETAVVERVVAQMDGKAALPRKNGELVFAAPWQGRAFGMAVALHERGLYEWEEFRQELIRAIAEAERSDQPFEYYACWLLAFERLLARRGILDPADVEERTFEFEFGEREAVF